jgi:hypothetical protein
MLPQAIATASPLPACVRKPICETAASELSAKLGNSRALIGSDEMFSQESQASIVFDTQWKTECIPAPTGQIQQRRVFIFLQR